MIPVSADTDGTELQVYQPSVLEIQLGSEWNGVEFELKTDAGMYPDKIPVGEDGVLRLEIGGSSVYTLTCLKSDVEIPEPIVESKDNAASGKNDEVEEPHTESEKDVAEENLPKQDSGSVAGIPIPHLVIFGCGLLGSIGILIAIRVVSGKRNISYEYDDEDEYDDE